MEEIDKIDTITKFLDDLEKLGKQLSLIQEEQKNETQEYNQLAVRSRDLQTLIDKYRPIYEERMSWIRDIKKKGKTK